LPLISSMTRSVTDAPQNVVRQLESAAQALDVAMQAAGAKGAYIAACIGKSEAYVSRLRSGKRAIPEKLVPALCMATGSNLLRQFFDMQERLSDDNTARLVAALRSAA
jgi:DNA-binding transcriptional regulator YdaS (Cro superfamily)